MIAVDRLSTKAGGFALRDISFQVPGGQYAVLMGRTGAGKTTILETICGLIRAQSGKVRLMEREVTRLKPGQRRIGYVPQERALFGSMSVYENLAFALRVQKMEPGLIKRRVGELSEMLGIQKLLDRTPAGLSGGESQRVALGRALAAKPPVLLLDEPLSALDDQSRQSIHDLLISVRRENPMTVLHVTHHLQDAQRLADQVLLLENGAVRQASVQQLPNGENTVAAQ